MAKRSVQALLLLMLAVIVGWMPSAYALDKNSQAEMDESLSFKDDPDGGDEIAKVGFKSIKNDPDGGDELTDDPDGGDEKARLDSIKNDPDGGDEVTDDPDGGDEATRSRMSANEASASGALKTIDG